MRSFLIIIIIISVAAPCSHAGVLFEDSFDDHADWSPTQQYSNGSTTSSHDGSSGTACTGCPSGSAKYRGYTVAKSAWSDYVGNNTLNISNTNVRGGVGKALTYSAEPIDACGDQSGWCSDANLIIALPSDQQEVYIRWFIKFDPDWVFDDGAIGASQKIMHMSHYDPAYNGEIMDWHGPATGNRPYNVMNFARSPSWGNNANIFWTPRYQASWTPNVATPALSMNRGDYHAIMVSGGTGSGGYKTWPELLLDGGWHSIQFRYKQNTTGGYYDGSPNGVFEVYLDGNVIYSRSDVAWADGTDTNNAHAPAPALGWNLVMLGGNSFNPVYPSTTKKEQWYAIDDVVISTEFIPDGYVIGGKTAKLSIGTGKHASGTGKFIQ